MKKRLGLYGVALLQLPTISFAEMARSSFTGDENVSTFASGAGTTVNFLDSGLGQRIAATPPIEEPSLWLLAALPESGILGLVIVVALTLFAVALGRHLRTKPFYRAAGESAARSVHF
jgi:hypothetical protein